MRHGWLNIVRALPRRIGSQSLMTRTVQAIECGRLMNLLDSTTPLGCVSRGRAGNSGEFCG